MPRKRRSVSSGPRITSRKAPPGRKSIFHDGSVNPRGPHHRTMCSGSIHILKTSVRGASKTRVMTSSRSFWAVSVLAAMSISLSLQSRRWNGHSEMSRFRRLRAPQIAPAVLIGDRRLGQIFLRRIVQAREVDRVKRADPVEAPFGERLHAASTAEAMVNDPAAELVVGEGVLALEYPEGARCHDRLPETALLADRAIAPSRLAREVDIHLELDRPAVTTARVGLFRRPVGGVAVERVDPGLEAAPEMRFESCFRALLRRIARGVSSCACVHLASPSSAMSPDTRPTDLS